MDEYLIYGDSLRKIAGEARRLIYSEAEMDADEIYEALRRVTPGEPIPSSDGVAFSSTQISPDADYRVNYNFMSQVVAHVQRMIGSKSDMTKEQILEGLSNVPFIPRTLVTSTLQAPELAGSTVSLILATVLSKVHLDKWSYTDKYVVVKGSNIQLTTDWLHTSVEQAIDVGRMTVLKIETSDLDYVSSIEVSENLEVSENA